MQPEFFESLAPGFQNSLFQDVFIMEFANALQLAPGHCAAWFTLYSELTPTSCRQRLGAGASCVGHRESAPLAMILYPMRFAMLVRTDVSRCGFLEISGRGMLRVRRQRRLVGFNAQ